MFYIDTVQYNIEYLGYYVNPRCDGLPSKIFLLPMVYFCKYDGHFS